MIFTLGCLSGLGLLIAVLAPSLPSGLDSGAIENAADYGIAQSDILDAAAAQENDGVLLEIVAHAGHISRHLHAVGQANASDLPDGRVGLFGRLGRHFDANAALEGRGEENGAILDGIESARQSDGFGLPLETLSMALCKLIDCWHSLVLHRSAGVSIAWRLLILA